MKKTNRLILVICCIVLLLAPVSAYAEEQPVTDTGEGYEQWFIDQHVDYINSSEYKENIMGTPGSEAAMIAEAFGKVSIEGWNRAWSAISYGMSMIGAEEIRWEDPVELIVADMMEKTLTGDEFSESYARSYCGALKDQVNRLSNLIGNDGVKAVRDMILQGSPDQLSDYADMLNTFIVSLEQIGKAGDTSSILNGCRTILEKIDSGLKKNFPSKISPKAFADLKAWWQLGDGALDIAGTSVEEFFNALVVYNAYQNASDNWKEFWNMVMAEAAVESASGYGKLIQLSETGDLSEEIENNLKELEKTRDKTTFSYFLSKSGKKIALTALEEYDELVINLLHDALPPGSKIRAIMDATKLTQQLINFLTNMDDSSFYGQMAFGTGELARCASLALNLASSKLISKETYENACAFDEVFHYYKALQLSAADYAIEYDKSITSAFLYPVVKKLTAVNPQYEASPWTRHSPQENNAKEQELELLISVRGIWAARECHKGTQFDIIAKHRSLWDPLQDPESYTNYYSLAVTDMNDNGRLEVITAWGMGTGRFTEFRMFEVNEEMTDLIPCEIDSEQFQPDINADEAVDVYRKDDQYWAVFRDFVRAGWAANATIQEALCLEEGLIEATVLGVCNVNVTQTEEEYVEETTYRDWNEREITEEEFIGLGDSYFTGCEKGKMTFRWIYSEDVGENPVPALMDSWQGFGCDLF